MVLETPIQENTESGVVRRFDAPRHAFPPGKLGERGGRGSIRKAATGSRVKKTGVTTGRGIIA